MRWLGFATVIVALVSAAPAEGSQALATIEAIPAQTGGFEGSDTGYWVSWYSADIERSADAAAWGSGSLKIVAHDALLGVRSSPTGPASRSRRARPTSWATRCAGPAVRRSR